MFIYLVICVILLLYSLSIKYHTYHLSALLDLYNKTKLFKVISVGLINTPKNNPHFLGKGETK